MNNKIDQLGENLKKITDSLTELKDKVGLSDADKKNQAETLKKEAAEIEKQIKEEIENLKNALQNETDETLKQELNKEKEKAEALLSSISEITNLYNSIVGTQALTSTPVQPLTEDKNIFTKAKNWVGDQWYDVRDKQKWKNETGKNILRTAGFVATGVGAVALAYKGVKKLWNRMFSDDEEEEEVETKPKKKKKKKPFWDRWYGKALKWAGIGTGIYWLTHGIFTGNWFEDLLGRGTLKTEKAKDQVNKYKELSPEVREKYESIGEKVNEFYGNVWDKEIKNGYESPYDLGTISKNVKLAEGGNNPEIYKGIVPFCMDDGLKNVEQLLSERNFTTYLFDKDSTEVMAQVKSWAGSAAGKVLGTFVGGLESFIPFSSGSGSLSDKIEKWLESDPQNRIDELNFFFRQYTKVLTYMKDKEMAIKYKIAEEKCQSELSGKSEKDKINFIQNKLQDNNWFENNIKNDSRYQNFMNSKISNSSEALTNAGVFDGEMSPILKEGIIEPLNNEFDNIMQVDEEGKTIVDKGLEEINASSLGNQTKTDLVNTCNYLKDDIVGNDNGGGWFERTFLGTSYLLNTDNSNKEKFLEETGLKDFMNKLSVKIDGIKEKINNGTVNEDELKQLKETILAYFAFQKEMEVAIYTFGSVRSTNPDMLRRLLESQVMGFNNFVERLNKIFNGDGSFEDFLVVGVGAGQMTLVMSSSARRAAGRTARKGFKRTVKQPKNAIVWVAGRPAFSNAGFRKALQGLSDATHKESYFLHYALNGKIKDERFLLDIAEHDLHLTNKNSMSDALLELLLKETANSGLEKKDCELLWKYAGNTDIKKLIMTEEDVGRGVSDMFADGFKPTPKKFTVDKTILKKLEDVDKLFNESYMTPKTKKLLEDLLRKSVHNVDDLDYLNKLFIDDDFFKCISEMEDTPKAIRGMAKHLDEVKKSTSFSTLTNEIQKITSSGANVTAKLNALEDYRRSLASISPKEFKITNECIKLFATNGGDFMSNMKIINKIVNEGIQASSGGRPKKITVSDLISNTDDVIRRLNDAAPSWKTAVGANELDSFVKALTDMKTCKMLKNADDAATVLSKVVKLAAKLT